MITASRATVSPRFTRFLTISSKPMVLHAHAHATSQPLQSDSESVARERAWIEARTEKHGGGGGEARGSGGRDKQPVSSRLFSKHLSMLLQQPLGGRRAPTGSTADRNPHCGLAHGGGSQAASHGEGSHARLSAASEPHGVLAHLSRVSPGAGPRGQFALDPNWSS